MKKITISFIAIMTIATSAEAVTLYSRSDQATVNNVTAYSMSLANSKSSSTVSADMAGPLGSLGGGASVDRIDILHSDGTTTNIALSIAMRTFNLNNLGTGLYVDQWQCSDIILRKTDALMFTYKMWSFNKISTAVFVTRPLGWSKLKASTWNFYRWLDVGSRPIGPPPFRTGELWVNLGFGDDTHPTRLEGVDFASYTDIGLTIRNGAQTVKIGALPLQPSHKLRVCKNGVIYGIPLLPVSDVNASAVRIFDGVEIKALPKIE